MQPNATITDKSLSAITVRQRAMLKLQLGCLPLNDGELAWVLPARLAESREVRPRSLEEVASLFGITRERVRQINKRSLRKLGLSENQRREVERAAISGHSSTAFRASTSPSGPDR
jgi:DNA-directed RNA polymerase sigma subunit (sigma70/sigma32)